MNNTETSEFYEAILDNVNAFIYINQIDELNDLTTAKNIWSNKRVLDYYGLTQEEIINLGHNYFIQYLHPDDLKVGTDSVDYMDLRKGDSFHGVYRARSKDGDYNWFNGNTVVFETRNGHPWKFLCIVININEEMQTREQLHELYMENQRLRNQLTLCRLTKREKQIIHYISDGKTDKEIASMLYISVYTANTHRKNILKKLQLTNAAELVRFSMEKGLI